MAGRVYGSFEGVAAKLGQAGGRIRKSINDQMENEAKAVQRIAQQMVPVDEGNMGDAIVIRSENQRRDWIIEVDESQPDDTGRYTVGNYLAFLHEGQYDLGPLSVAKQATSPYRVGNKFLERAFQQRMRTGLIGRLTAAAKRLGIMD